jgi:putative Mg2+ transporter-C (MgtC) family protein
MDVLLVENLIKLGMSVLVGGLIGSEREFRVKAAGFRTIILITVGSTLFTIFSMSIDPEHSRTTIAGNIVQGIGFLGAGAIIRDGGRIGGLTTAATIWISAALGMGIGAGEFTFVLPSAVAVLIVLLLFPRVEHWIHRMSEFRTYQIVMDSRDEKSPEKIQQALAGCSLRIYEMSQKKTENTLVGKWHLVGAPKDHDRFILLMLQDVDVKEFEY